MQLSLKQHRRKLRGPPPQLSLKKTNSRSGLGFFGAKFQLVSSKTSNPARTCGLLRQQLPKLNVNCETNIFAIKIKITLNHRPAAQDKSSSCRKLPTPSEHDSWLEKYGCVLFVATMTNHSVCKCAVTKKKHSTREVFAKLWRAVSTVYTHLQKLTRLGAQEFSGWRSPDLTDWQGDRWCYLPNCEKKSATLSASLNLPLVQILLRITWHLPASIFQPLLNKVSQLWSP